MAISKGPEGRVTITSFAMQPPSQVLNPWDESKIQSRLQECDSILFSAYRTSTKLALLQEALKLNLVKLNIVTHVLGHHGLGPSENNSLLTWNEVHGILRDIYSAGSKIRNYYSPSLNIEAYAKAAKKILVEIYGEGDDKSLSVHSLKTFLILLSQGVLREKFVYLFRQCAHINSDHCLSRKDLKNHLISLVKFPEYFKESRSFGPEWIDSAVGSCFALMNSGRPSERDSLNEEVYLRWQLMEPQLLVWLPTFYRQTSAQGIRHGMRCSNCRTQDIIGLRYQCLRCLKYESCQHCFFYGHVSGSHKVHHPMQEYCYRSTRRDETLAFLKKLTNKFRKRNSKDVRGRYLPAAVPSSKETPGHDGSSGFHSESERRELSPPLPLRGHQAHYHQLVISRQRRHEVKSIIRSLEEINEKRSEVQSESQVIHSVREQLNQLKNLLETLFNDNEGKLNSFEAFLPPEPGIPNPELPHLLGSTPLVPIPHRKRHYKPDNKLAEITLSPIVKQDNRISSSNIRPQGEEEEEEEDKQGLFTSVVKVEPSKNFDLKSSVSCQDISSLISKGPFEDNFSVSKNMIHDDQVSKKTEEEEILSEEEIQSLMGRLENVFKSIENSQEHLELTPSNRSKNLARFEVNKLVTEISDQMNSFSRNIHD